MLVLKAGQGESMGAGRRPMAKAHQNESAVHWLMSPYIERMDYSACEPGCSPEAAVTPSVSIRCYTSTALRVAALASAKDRDAKALALLTTAIRAANPIQPTACPSGDGPAPPS